MTLVAADAVGLGEEAQQEIKDKWDTIDDVEVELLLMGLGPLEKPSFSFVPLNPGSVERMSGDELTNTYEMYHSWHGFAANALGRIRGRINQHDTQLKIMAAQLRKGSVEAAKVMKLRKPSKESMEDGLLLDPGYQALMLELQKAEQMKYQLETWVDSFERGMRLISRQVEIRRQALDGGLATGRPVPGRL